MSKKQKKRTKRYTGVDATPSQPVVHHYTAVVRSPLGEWWADHKRAVRVIAIIVAVVIIGGYLLYELIRLVF